MMYSVGNIRHSIAQVREEMMYSKGNVRHSRVQVREDIMYSVGNVRHSIVQVRCPNQDAGKDMLLSAVLGMVSRLINHSSIG